MLSNLEIKAWLATLPDDATIGVDEGGLTLQVLEDDDAHLEVGGMPGADDVTNSPATSLSRPTTDQKLPLIGRSYALIHGLAKQIHKDGVRGRSIAKLHETLDGRGFYFEVQIMDPDDNLPAGHIARVQVTLDRFDQEAASRG